MVLIFHEIGHNQAGLKAGACIEVFFKEGLLSKALLMQAGKLPTEKNPYERFVENSLAWKEAALKRREEWIKKRTEALKDNPQLLKNILDSGEESTWWKDDEGISGHEVFYEPGHPAHREENVFFGYSEHPSADRDWVAIEVPETATLHDASCRDRNVPDEWSSTAVTIKKFIEMQASGKTPPSWQSRYNEHLIRDRVPAERIVAYAKVEKELPFKKPITDEELKQVQNFVSNKLGFATQFNDPKDNVLVHKKDGKYQIRVSFNKVKISGREGEASGFFDQFQSFQELINEAKTFSTPTHLPADHPRHPEYTGDQKEKGFTS
jgi:hypothetical protein